MPTFGKRPDVDFPSRSVLDGTEELYTQTGGTNEKFTVSQLAAYINGLAATASHSFVDDFSSLPTGVDINNNLIYVVRDYQSTGRSRSYVYDTSINNWRQLNEDDEIFVVVNTVGELPVSGNENVVYHVIDDGHGRPALKRWNGSGYVELDQDTRVFEYADITARDAAASTAIKEGVVALITDADGSGNFGISFGKSDNTWSTPVINGGSGSGGNPSAFGPQNSDKLFYWGINGALSYSRPSVGVGTLTVGTVENVDRATLVIDTEDKVGQTVTGDFTLTISFSQNMNTWAANGSGSNWNEMDLYIPQIHVFNGGQTLLGSQNITDISHSSAPFVPYNFSWSNNDLVIAFSGSSDFGSLSRILLSIKF